VSVIVHFLYNIRNAWFTGVRHLGSGSVGVPLSMGRTWFFPLVVVLPIDPRRRVPVNNLIYFISLLYAYLLLIHIYVMYYTYIVLSWCTPMYDLLSINYLNLNLHITCTRLHYIPISFHLPHTSWSTITNVQWFANITCSPMINKRSMVRQYHVFANIKKRLMVRHY
jgi:hypothetical protein